MVTNLLLAAFVLVESSGNWSAVGDQGRSLGGLQIQPVMVQHYNRATGSKVKHAQVKDRKTAEKIATWYFGYCQEKYRRPLNAAELYQCWNAGPDAVARKQSRARGIRAARIYWILCAKESQRMNLIYLRSQANNDGKLTSANSKKKGIS